jgi:RNA polymerase sigma-70 factor (ECF subfamily)
MLFHDSRRDARTTDDGELVLLEEQDRALWHHAEIAEGRRVLERALAGGRPGVYQLQAAIAELHTHAATDWQQIALLYEALLARTPSPVVALNRAVAVALSEGPEAGLLLLDEITGLDEYHLFYSARADLLRRAGRREEAAAAYRSALELATNEPERRFLVRRLGEVTTEP